MFCKFENKMKNDYDLPNMLKNCELRTDRQNFFSAMVLVVLWTTQMNKEQYIFWGSVGDVSFVFIERFIYNNIIVCK